MVKLDKKVKGSSKVKMKPLTEEEKLIRLEMLALQQEESRRSREESARLRLQSRLARESEIARANSLKLHAHWRAIMRGAKAEEMRAGVEIAAQNHEREMDRKDAMIQMLDRDLEDAEEQYQVALRSHLQIIDQIMSLQFAWTQASGVEITDEFNTAVTALEQEFETERNDYTAAHAHQRKDLLDMMSAMETEFGQAESDARQEFESAREEIRNRHAEEYNVLKISLESTIEELQRQFDHAHQAYLSATDQRASSFKELTERDASSASIIEKRMRKLSRLQESLAVWRAKTGTNTREWEGRNRALREEKEAMAGHYQAERILKLGELNRKMETEREKVLPFHPLEPCAGNNKNEEGEEGTVPKELMLTAKELGLQMGDGAQSGDAAESEVPVKPMSSYATDENGKMVEEWDYLNNFFKRYNKEQARLLKENADLRQILKQYLDGISVNHDVLTAPQGNPLFVVNHKLRLNAPAAYEVQRKAASNAQMA
eukprot:jgi/Chlat1/2547/Chrsp175S00145